MANGEGIKVAPGSRSNRNMTGGLVAIFFFVVLIVGGFAVLINQGII